MAVRQMKNEAVVEGLLSEINLDKGSYNDRDGVKQDTLMGSILVRVTQEIEKGEGEKTIEVPVRFFTRKLTNAGNVNPVYAQLEQLMQTGNSIAVVGEVDADAVRVTGARLAMQEYYNNGGFLTQYPSISGSFVNVIRRNDMVSRAVFICEAVIDTLQLAVDSEGVEIEPKTLQLNGVHVGYGEYTDIIPFTSRRTDIITGIQNAYSVGDTITLSGKLNFDTRTETFKREVEIGDPVEEQRTIRVSEFLIDGVAQRDILSEDYTEEEVRHCLNQRTARLERKKAEAENKRQATTNRSHSDKQEKPDLGF